MSYFGPNRWTVYIFVLYKERTEDGSRATKLSTRCSIGQKDMTQNGHYLFYAVLNIQGFVTCLVIDLAVGEMLKAYS